MKKIVILAIALMAVACEKTNPSTRVGADRDEHNCIASAGYTFSALKNGCVRLWEDGISLLPLTSSDGALLAAYVIVGNDTAEVFLPQVQKPLMLVLQTAEEASQWVSADGSGWELVQDAFGKWTLYQNDEPLYADKQVID